MSDFLRPFIGPFILLALLALSPMLVLGILGISEWASHIPDSSSSSEPIGRTKRIRVSNTRLRHDLPVFITKDALIRYMLAFNSGDTDTLFNSLAKEKFPVDDFTAVRVLDYDPSGNGLYKIEVLEGYKKSRVAWVMGMDLRD